MAMPSPALLVTVSVREPASKAESTLAWAGPAKPSSASIPPATPAASETERVRGLDRVDMGWCLLEVAFSNQGLRPPAAYSVPDPSDARLRRAAARQRSPSWRSIVAGSKYRSSTASSPSEVNLND